VRHDSSRVYRAAAAVRRGSSMFVSEAVKLHLVGAGIALSDRGVHVLKARRVAAVRRRGLTSPIAW
jgi:hypothetical protein